MAKKDEADQADDAVEQTADAAAAEDDAPAEPAAPLIPGTAGIVDPNAAADAVAAELGRPAGEDPDPEQFVEPTAAEEPPTPKRGEVLVRYRGHADAFDYGDIKFRPGIWVSVKRAAAEDLATFPHEEFEVMEADGDG